MRIIDMPEFKDKQNVLSFETTTPLKDAVNEMAEKNYGACLVTTKGKLSGIFTERDILRKVVSGKGVDLKKAKLKDVMTTNPKTARENDKVADCMRRMSQGRFRHMPVVDDKGKILGMLSQGDFVAFTMSDVVARLGSSAKANVTAGRGTPVSIIIAMGVYTLMLLFLIAGAGHIFGF